MLRMRAVDSRSRIVRAQPIDDRHHDARMQRYMRFRPRRRWLATPACSNTRKWNVSASCLMRNCSDNSLGVSSRPRSKSMILRRVGSAIARNALSLDMGLLISGVLNETYFDFKAGAILKLVYGTRPALPRHEPDAPPAVTALLAVLLNSSLPSSP